MIFLAFVVPIAIYCLVLALLNRCRHPVLVPGPWDFAGVLFAASGFLLLGGPAILTGLYEEWRLSWLLGQTRFLNGAAENWSFWINLWVLYFGALVLGSAVVLWRRRNQTSIYNVEPAALEEALSQVVDRLGFESVRVGPGRFFLCVPQGRANGDGRGVTRPVGVPAGTAANLGPAPSEQVAEPARQGELIGQPVLPPSRDGAQLRIDPFPTMYHVTLHWADATGMIRRELEAELAKSLAEVWTRANPVAAFFLSLSSVLFFLTFLGFLVLLVFRILNLPR